MCEQLGCPVEGMTGQCPVCGEAYCFGHLGNHKHRFSDIRGVANRLSVMGVGRVGTYENAVKNHRSRNRRYWVIAYFDNRDKAWLGYQAVEDSPHFKNKGEAESYLGNLGMDRRIGLPRMGEL
jgi:hypothetical protein